MLIRGLYANIRAHRADICILPSRDKSPKAVSVLFVETIHSAVPTLRKASRFGGTRRAHGRSVGSDPYRDHDPRQDFTKRLSYNDPGPGEPRRFMVGLHEVHSDSAVTWSQQAGCDLDNPGKGCWVADRPDGFGSVAVIGAKVLASMEHPCQRLALLGWEHLMVMALHVKGSVEVVTHVRVPLPITAWHHDEELTLRRTPNP